MCKFAYDFSTGIPLDLTYQLSTVSTRTLKTLLLFTLKAFKL